MSELDEIEERGEQVRQDSSLLPISFSAAVLAVLVALVTLLGHRAHTEELLMQSKSSDMWAEYQAKSIRESMQKSFAQVLTVVAPSNKDAAKKLSEDFAAKGEQYKKDKEGLKERATEIETEQHTAQRKADRFDLGEALLEMALVITSVTLITRRREFWYFGLGMGVLGVVSALLGFFYHA